MKKNLTFAVIGICVLGLVFFVWYSVNKITYENDVPQINVLLPGSSFPYDSPIGLTLTKKNIPLGSGLVLRIIRDDDGKGIGPLMSQPQLISGTGVEIFNWDGKKVGCAPTDFIKWCDVEANRYRIKATVYDRADFSILGKNIPTEKKVIAEYETLPFELIKE